MPTSTTREYRGSHLHPQSNTKIHLLPKKSRSHYHSHTTSNVKSYNLVPLFFSAKNYQPIVPGHTPNVHLIPYGNANDQNKYTLDLPFSATQSLEKFGHPFHAVTQLPSSTGTPIPGSPFLGKDSSHWKIQQPR